MSGSNSSARPARLDEPLGLTVHSLPVPQEAALAEGERTVRGRWKMLAVLAVCAAPVIASYFMYYVVQPQGKGTNYGQLIQPQRPLPPALAALKGQWLLVSVAGGACDSACEKHLYLQRQLREGLGKDKERLDWVWIVSDAAPVRASLQPALKQADVVRLREAQLAQWLAPAPGHALSEHLYVVDPLGNWMMRFPAGQDFGSAPKVRRDLERLMRASAGWDQPGR